VENENALAAVGELDHRSLAGKRHDQDKRIAAYKEADISDTEAQDLIIRAVDDNSAPSAPWA